MKAYKEWCPPEDLAPWIECFWTRVDDADARAVDVLPDGCTDLILERTSGRAFLVGTMTRPLHVASEPRDLIAVRFHPGAATSFFSYPAPELVDHLIGAGEIGGRGIVVAEPDEPQERSLDRLASELRKRKSEDQSAERARSAAMMMQTRSIEMTASLLGISRQHLRRSLRDHVGISPKRLSRILRFRRACAALRAPDTQIADVAARLGYADQSHMNRDMREFGGVPASGLSG